MALDAIIFDLDGTLIDTNAYHIEAWRRAFEASGYRINADRIAVEVGKGGDTLVPSILGKEADERDGDTLREREPEEFKKLAEKSGIKFFPGTFKLMAELRRRKIKTVLATSSGKKQLATSEKFAHVKWKDFVDQITNADDIKRSKPHPDLVQAAVAKLKLSPAQCAMVGDTPWDIQAAQHAGVICIGLTGGGNPGNVLREAGARAVYQDVGDLLRHLDEALEKCSPGPTHVTSDLLESLMREAIRVAESAIEKGEAPIGCVLARGDGTIIARGHNEQNTSQNKIAHAEIVAFANAAGKVPLDARDLLLVSTLEPCVMCTGAAMESAIDTIVFGLRAPADNGSTRVRPPQSPECKMPRIVGDVLSKECRKLFERFLKTNPRHKQKKYVEQLLRETRC